MPEPALLSRNPDSLSSALQTIASIGRGFTLFFSLVVIALTVFLSSPVPLPLPPGVQMRGEKLRSDIPEAGVLSRAHQEPPGGAKLSLPFVQQGLPLPL